MNKNLKRISTIVTFVGLFFVFTFPPYLMVLFDKFPSLDKSPAKVLELLLLPETKYAAGYTDEKFGSIRMGMTEKQVLSILGEPLTRWRPYQHTRFKEKSHFIGFQYSESPSSTHYNLRQINLDGGKVAEIISYFYID